MQDNGNEKPVSESYIRVTRTKHNYCNQYIGQTGVDLSTNKHRHRKKTWRLTRIFEYTSTLVEQSS